MDKVGDWLNSIPLVGITVVSFIIGALYGKGLPTVAWETIAAGFLGLAGGTFAWFAARAQIEAQKEQRSLDIKREENLLNSQCYSYCVEVGDLVFAWAETTRAVFNSGVQIDEGMAQTLHEGLAAIDIPPHPMTAPSDIGSTLIGLRVFKSRLIQTIVAMERSARIKSSSEIEAKELPKVPKSTFDLIDYIQAYGVFLKEEALNELITCTDTSPSSWSANTPNTFELH
ncbi:hypothetical protein L6172_08170 [Thalassospiraceae bacterium SW-3-3]|nr:hypothetical protein L6172_08170 [Thalassospiraceae bacterium SW-3-3]